MRLAVIVGGLVLAVGALRPAFADVPKEQCAALQAPMGVAAQAAGNLAASLENAILREDVFQTPSDEQLRMVRAIEEHRLNALNELKQMTAAVEDLAYEMKKCAR